MVSPATRRVLLVVAPMLWLVAIIGTMAPVTANEHSVDNPQLAFAPVQLQVAAGASATAATAASEAPVSTATDTPATSGPSGGISVPWELVVGGILGLFIGIWFIPRLPKRQK